jgi:hypothetical protein
MRDALTSKEQLPTWDICRARVEDGTASALERFIFENEPSYVGGVEMFRQLLAEVVTKAYEPISPGTNRQPTSNPMRNALRELADAAEEQASSEPDMPSNNETCQRFDAALATARAVLATPSETSEVEKLRAALAMIYDKWEDGTPCYEDPEDFTGHLGNAFKLTQEEEAQILALLPPGPALKATASASLAEPAEDARRRSAQLPKDARVEIGSRAAVALPRHEDVLPDESSFPATGFGPSP